MRSCGSLLCCMLPGNYAAIRTNCFYPFPILKVLYDGSLPRAYIIVCYLRKRSIRIVLTNVYPIYCSIQAVPNAPALLAQLVIFQFVIAIPPARSSSVFASRTTIFIILLCQCAAIRHFHFQQVAFVECLRRCPLPAWSIGLPYRDKSCAVIFVRISSGDLVCRAIHCSFNYAACAVIVHENVAAVLAGSAFRLSSFFRLVRFLLFLFLRLFLLMFFGCRRLLLRFLQRDSTCLQLFFWFFFRFRKCWGQCSGAVGRNFVAVSLAADGKLQCQRLLRQVFGDGVVNIDLCWLAM